MKILAAYTCCQAGGKAFIRSRPSGDCGMLLLDYRVYGALFGAVLIALFLGIFSNALVAGTPANPPGFDLPSSAAPAKKAAVAAAVPLPDLLAKADADKGKTLT